MKKSHYALAFISKNVPRIKKPISKKTSVLLSILLVLFFVLLFHFSDSLKENQAIIVGVAGASCISIIVMAFTLNTEARKNYYKAKKAAKVLAEVLQSVYNQITHIEHGSISSIYYPSNWLEYYEDCALYLEYDYLDTLLQIFEIINAINLSFDDEAKVHQLICKWNYLITDSTKDFCILTVQYNLEMFSMEKAEDKPWKAQKSYLDFKMHLSEKYSNTIILLSKEYLEKNAGKDDADKVQYYVMKKLREIGDLRNGEYMLNVVDNKQMLDAIFNVYLSLKKTDPLELCWGSLSIKEAGDNDIPKDND